MRGSAWVAAVSRRRFRRVAGLISFWAPIAGVLIVFLPGKASEPAIAVEQPALLAAACLCVVAPLRWRTAEVVQRVTAFYLLCVAFNELAERYVELAVAGVNLKISVSAVTLSICAIGYAFQGAGAEDRGRCAQESDLSGAWAAVVGVIAAHMFVLWGLLKVFYGYGYERDFHVLGRVCMCVLLFVFLWGELGSGAFRRVLGLILGAYFVVILAAG